MTNIAKIVLAGFVLVTLAAPALAHHSAAAYDTQKEVRLSGTITQYRFGNPHVYMILQVRKPDGTTNAVEVEAGAASVLNPLGFKKDSLAVGDVVTIVGNPGRNNADQFLLGKDLYKQDGSYIPLRYIGSRDYQFQGTSNGPFNFIARQHTETFDRTLSPQPGSQKPDLLRRHRRSRVSG